MKNHNLAMLSIFYFSKFFVVAKIEPKSKDYGVKEN